jgi:lysozyme family protein
MRVHPKLIAQIDRVVTRLWTPTTKPRYQAIAAAAGLPVECGSAFIALAHERESSGNWERSLAQGDPLACRSVNVPAGRIPPPAEPPFTFEAAAIDGLVACDHVNQWTDWSIPGMLTKEELWNGAGYYFHGVPSAYVWAGSDQYLGGKFVGDGRWDPSAWDHQLGTAVLFARMLAADPELRSLYTPDMPTEATHPAMPPPVTPAALHDNAWVQAQMNLLGQHEPYRDAILGALAELHPPGAFPLTVDGDYGQATKQAVRGFQRAHGDLLDDGKCGRVTQPEIEKAVAALT